MTSRKPLHKARARRALPLVPCPAPQLLKDDVELLKRAMLQIMTQIQQPSQSHSQIAVLFRLTPLTQSQQGKLRNKVWLAFRIQRVEKDRILRASLDPPMMPSWWMFLPAVPQSPRQR